MTDRDTIVVGGGHNGLVAAFYLARGGLRPLVLERRPFVGGACVTEEFAPGFRASSGAYVLSMLREPIWRDMRLAERGLTVDPAGPSLHVFDDGARLQVDEDLDVTARELRRFSWRDAAEIERFEADLGRLARVIMPMADWTPPKAHPRAPSDFGALLRMGVRGARCHDAILDAAWLFAASASQCLSERFTSEHVKAALGWHAINDSVLGPSSPGTAYVLLHDHASEQAGGGVRSWGFVRGGIGRVTSLMADAAREAGVEIRTDAEVERVLVRDGRAAGVVLRDGQELAAERVLSNADPKRTCLGLVDPAALPAEYRARLAAYRCEGTSMKITLGVDHLPSVTGMPQTGVQPYQTGIMEFTQPLADMDRAQAEAQAGIPAADPHIELCIPTVHDPSLAPAGCHVITIDVNSQPYTLREGGWDAVKERVADAAIERLARHMPDLPGSILHREVLSPLDLERRLGLTGGHALHGDMSFDQLFAFRPVRGWADYRTPLPGLYLCGAGTHPGGGVTGASGRNCAREVLRAARAVRRSRRMRQRAP